MLSLGPDDFKNKESDELKEIIESGREHIEAIAGRKLTDKEFRRVAENIATADFEKIQFEKTVNTKKFNDFMEDFNILMNEHFDVEFDFFIKKEDFFPTINYKELVNALENDLNKGDFKKLNMYALLSQMFMINKALTDLVKHSISPQKKDIPSQIIDEMTTDMMFSKLQQDFTDNLFSSVTMEFLNEQIDKGLNKEKDEE